MNRCPVPENPNSLGLYNMNEKSVDKSKKWTIKIKEVQKRVF